MSRNRSGQVCRASALAVAAALFMACVSAQTKDPHGFDRAPLFGMIYDHDSQPVPGVDLSLDGRRGPQSDLMGRFVLPDLARGDHRLIAARAGYEALGVDLRFINQTQVLYLQMYSQSQLVAEAEQQIKAREWAKAQQVLDRAAKIDPQDVLLRYLRAVLAFRRAEDDAAIAELRGLPDSAATEPAVYLFLADIYQYRLKDRITAEKMLTLCLERRGGPELEKRLEELRSGTATRLESPEPP